jgi:hypothetical protein
MNHTDALYRAQIAGRIFNPDPDPSPDLNPDPYCYCVQYTCTLQKSVDKNMPQLIGNEVIKLLSLFSCFRYKRPTTGHRFGWVLTLFIKCWKNNFTFSICALYAIVSRAVRVQGWPGLKLFCDLGSEQPSSYESALRIRIWKGVSWAQIITRN